MKSLARTSKLALLGLTGLLALPASADVGIYGGLQAGYSTTDTNKDVIELDDDVNYGIYGGYKFVDWLGIEAGLARLGKFEPETVLGNDVEDGSDLSIEINSFYTGISLWGKFLGPVNIFAKLGAHYSESKAEDDSDLDKSSYGLYYAAGLEFPIVDFLSITLTYQNFRNVDLLENIDYDDEDGAESSFGDAGVDMLSAGVMFQF